MTEWEVQSRYNYSKLAPPDRRAFDRWQKDTAVTASLFAMVLLAMAVNAWFSPGPVTTAVAERQATTDGLSTGITRVGQDLPTQEAERPF